MPVGNEIGAYNGTFTSIRVLENDGDNRVLEGSYTGTVTGALSGTVVGTMTFSGTDAGGTLSDKGLGYLDSGDILSGRGHGLYWGSGKGVWETRAAFLLNGEQKLVGEGQITLSGTEVSMSGKIFELT